MSKDIKITIITKENPIIENEDNNILVTATTNPASIIDQLIGHYGYKELRKVLDERTATNKHIIYYLHKGLTLDAIFKALENTGLSSNRYHLEPITELNPPYVKIFFHNEEDHKTAMNLSI